jgi:hypothetical protein
LYSKDSLVQGCMTSGTEERIVKREVMRAGRNVVPIGTCSVFALSKRINMGAREGKQAT